MREASQPQPTNEDIEARREKEKSETLFFVAVNKKFDRVQTEINALLWKFPLKERVALIERALAGMEEKIVTDLKNEVERQKQQQ